MIIEDLEQRSAEWLTMRQGMVTASRVADVLAVLKKGGPAAARTNYLMEVVVGRLTNFTPDHFITPAMQWGIDNECFARAAYELHADVSVQHVGFAIHPAINFFGASPDGLVGSDGLLEIKCPTSDTHLSYLMAGTVPEQYIPQMLAGMTCTERKWCDFVSFDPRFPKHLQLFVRRFERDDARILEMECRVIEFLAEVDSILGQLTEGQS